MKDDPVFRALLKLKQGTEDGLAWLGKADPFDRVVDEIQLLNRRKRADYAVTAEPWSNFMDAGKQVNAHAGTAVEVLIATKQSRLRALTTNGTPPRNEGIRDTLLDRCVYSIIALAMYDEGLYGRGSVPACMQHQTEVPAMAAKKPAPKKPAPKKGKPAPGKKPFPPGKGAKKPPPKK